MKNVTDKALEDKKMFLKGLSKEIKILLIVVYYIAIIILSLRIGKYMTIKNYLDLNHEGTPEASEYIVWALVWCGLVYGGFFKFVRLLIGFFDKTEKFINFVLKVPYVSIFIIINNIVHITTGSFIGTIIYKSINEILNVL